MKTLINKLKSDKYFLTDVQIGVLYVVIIGSFIGCVSVVSRIYCG